MENSLNITFAKGLKLPFHEDEKDFLEIRKDIIRESLSEVFDKISNFETIATIGNVEYVNDSSSLTVNNTGSSLLHCFKPVTWILSRPDNFSDYSEISEIVEDRVKNIICINRNVNDVINAFGSGSAQLVINAGTMDEAVKIAAIIANPGEMVLFSPASYHVDVNDGRLFNKTVREIKKKHSPSPVH